MSAPSELHIQKLTLFTHGVAQLELSATVQGDTTLTHTFPERHMNDLLKSLTVVDTVGKISSITYNAPVAERSLETPVQIGKNDALKTLLEQTQGAKVVVNADGDEAINATLLGLQWPLDPRHEKAEDSEDSVKLVLMEESFRVISLRLDSVKGILFEEPRLQKRLNFSLAHFKQVNTPKKGNIKSVRIVTKGTEERTVLVNYAVESPIPKHTYRFLLKQSDETESVFVQWWAIVDNPTDHDLEEIDMAIVSGMPMSFRHDLYDTRYVKRPTEKVVTKKAHGNPSQATFGHFGQGGTTFGGSGFGRGFGGGGTIGGRDKGGVQNRGSVFGQPGASDQLFSAQPTRDRTIGVGEEESEGSGLDSDGGWQDEVISGRERVTEAESSEIGNLYEYSIPAKVSIKSRESALVPLIMRDVEGSRVDIYSRKVRSGNTLSAVRIKNSTDGAFEAGPVCVYERSRLVGEGMMKGCRPGGEVFVPYSVNLDCTVRLKEKSVNGGLVKVGAVDGMFEVVSENRRIVLYTFENRTEESVLYVLHEINTGFESPSASKVLASGEASGSGGNDKAEDVELKEVVEGVARFRMSVPSEQTVTLQVTERQHTNTRQDIRGSCTESTIKELEKKKALSMEVLQLMKDVMNKEKELASIRNEFFKHSARLQSLKESQERFRSNLESLGILRENSCEDPAIKKFVNGLAESENGIQDMEKLMKDTEERGKVVEEALTEIVAEIAEGETGKE